MKKAQSADQTDVIIESGSYSYTAPDGTLITLTYTADDVNGFQPQVGFRKKNKNKNIKRRITSRARTIKSEHIHKLYICGFYCFKSFIEFREPICLRHHQSQRLFKRVWTTSPVIHQPKNDLSTTVHIDAYHAEPSFQSFIYSSFIIFHRCHLCVSIIIISFNFFPCTFCIR